MSRGRGLPNRTPVTTEPEGRRYSLSEADTVFAALSSEMAREVLRRLSRAPAPASDVADAVDTSVQNVAYHLDRLEAAGLVEHVDSWYSAKGREMAVYAAVPVTIVCAPEGEPRDEQE
jgi:predicted transcriptional regulator